MDNNKGRWLFSIFLLFICLTFLFFLNAAPLNCADLPPLDSGSLPFGSTPFPGAYAPPGGGFFPPSGVPYGLPYQNPGLGFAPPTAQFGVPYQNPGLGFAPPTAQFGVPYQNPGLGFVPTGAPYGFPPQTPGFNLPPSLPYGPVLPYVPPTSDAFGSNNTFPVFNTSYNPGAFPNQGFYGPISNIYSPSPVPQPFPGVPPYGAGTAPGFIDPRAGLYGAPYGNMAPLPGAFPQQGYPGVPFPGPNPMQPFNPWGANPQWNQPNPWQPQGYGGTNINPYAPYNPYQYPYSFNPYPSYDVDDDDDDGGNGGQTVDLPDIKGHWAGTWEAWLTDPNLGVVTDPNTDEIIIIMSGDIRFHVTQQPSSGGAVMGTIEIKGWNIDPAPQDWPGNWTGESDEVVLTGWIDQYTRYLNARYYYYPGKEEFGDYDANLDYGNIKGLYTWIFNTNQLNITDSGISGQFSVSGTNQYYITGVFSTAKYQPQ